MSEKNVKWQKDFTLKCEMILKAKLIKLMQLQTKYNNSIYYYVINKIYEKLD